MTVPRMTSVIMVSYHTGPVLQQAIDAVLAQSVDVELILVNNGNPPEVEADLIARFKDEPLVRVMTGHGNIGFGRACNLGARVAQGDHLLFLNPDSVLPPDALTKLYETAHRLKRPFMVGARLLDGEGHDQRGCRRALLTPMTAFIEAFHLHRFFPKIRLNFNEEPLPKALTPMPAISGAFMFIPTIDFFLLRGFDEGFFLHVEDLDLCWRFRQAGGEIYFDPSIVVTHLGGTSEVTSLFIEKQKAIGFVRYFEQNFTQTTPALLLKVLKMAIWARYGLKALTSYRPRRR